jgi:hypothetical protein
VHLRSGPKQDELPMARLPACVESIGHQLDVICIFVFFDSDIDSMNTAIARNASVNNHGNVDWPFNMSVALDEARRQ